MTIVLDEACTVAALEHGLADYAEYKGEVCLELSPFPQGHPVFLSDLLGVVILALPLSSASSITFQNVTASRLHLGLDMVVEFLSGRTTPISCLKIMCLDLVCTPDSLGRFYALATGDKIGSLQIDTVAFAVNGLSPAPFMAAAAFIPYVLVAESPDLFAVVSHLGQPGAKIRHLHFFGLQGPVQAATRAFLAAMAALPEGGIAFAVCPEFLEGGSDKFNQFMWRA